tara:strand:- start:27 stop:713 length:687 start_codon:yes stop_codon:yes gene_type:complete
MKFQIVIPARKNSKRLRGKNLKLLGGKPLIQYSIELVKNNFKNLVWVNSDDEKILKLSNSLGVEYLKRPEELASDTTPTVDVLKFQLDYFKKNSIPCDAIILLQPTSPFRSLNLLNDCIKCFKESKNSSLATFSHLNKKIGKINNNIFNPINYLPGQRSQDLDNFYFENGSIYITSINNIKNSQIITDDVYPYITNNIKYAIDIDTMEDFRMAEHLINLKYEKKLYSD